MKFTEYQDTIELTGENSSYLFQKEDGRLILAKRGENGCAMAGIIADAGVDGQYARGTQVFDCLDEKRTWELPQIAPTGVLEGAFQGFQWEDGALAAAYQGKKVEIRQLYDLCGECLRVQVKVKNLSAGRVTVNGVAFTAGVGLKDGYAEFPANVPGDQFFPGQTPAYQAVSCGLAGSMTHVENKEGHLNVLFLDEMEKWSQGAYAREEDLCCCYIAAVECWLEPEEECTCGNLYIQPVAEGEDPYLMIRDFFDGLGYHPALDGLREGVLYSCHPYGTMDNDFQRPKDMYAYAKELPDIKALGVDHIWVLPIFEHLDRGVYHPTDQKIIDKRYGGDEAVQYFIQEAHKLGMTVLFDYVPHGPAPEDPLAKEKAGWCSVRRDLRRQAEWNCVSFDMTNPEYLRYTSDLVNNHVRRFDIDGARIDCAMGGLSNWAAGEGRRPSASNLRGGVEISGAIKKGFLEMGKKALTLPENFNPVPVYYPVTDVFYGMNLYRALVMFQQDQPDGKTLAKRLTRFLEIEHKVMPPELKKLRFLGNHDTVSWVWQKCRAYEAYGLDKAKALFALMAFIDGVPMIYQGDEDPKIAGKNGPVMRAFFQRLYQARKQYLGEGVQIEYLHLDQGAMAFERDTEFGKRLVLINLENGWETVSLAQLRGAKPCYQGIKPKGDTAMLPAYAAEIYEVMP